MLRWISQYDHPLGCVALTARWYSTNLILDLFFPHAPKNPFKKKHTFQKRSIRIQTACHPPPPNSTLPPLRQETQWCKADRKVAWRWATFFAKGVLPHPKENKNNSPDFLNHQEYDATWDVKKTVNNGINYLSTGAGFLNISSWGLQNRNLSSPILLLKCDTTCQPGLFVPGWWTKHTNGHEIINNHGIHIYSIYRYTYS